MLFRSGYPPDVGKGRAGGRGAGQGFFLSVGLSGLTDGELRRLLVRLSLASRGSVPIWWLEQLPVRELLAWGGAIAEELNRMAEDE